jgi:hypothetical protein
MVERAVPVPDIRGVADGAVEIPPCLAQGLVVRKTGGKIRSDGGR